MLQRLKEQDSEGISFALQSDESGKRHSDHANRGSDATDSGAKAESGARCL